MYEELYAPLPDVGAYLARIGLSGSSPEPTVEWLDRLVHAQLLHIPFDDMDVWGRGDCPDLGIEALFDKIIRRKRGGYCYELNSLFCAFLKALGYDAYMVLVTLVGGRDFIPPPAHCAVICRIDGEQYFSDVGLGGPVPDGCVKFDTTAHGFRVGTEGPFRLVERLDPEKVTRVMLFRDFPTLPVELIPANFHVSQRPGSLFRSTLSLNLRLEDGSCTVSNRKFRYRNGTEVIERELASPDELREILPKYFGIPAEEPPYREFDAPV